MSWHGTRALMHNVLARNDTRPYDEPHLFAYRMQPLHLTFWRPLVLLVCLSAAIVPAQDRRYFNHKSSLTFTNSRAVDFTVRGDQAFVTDFLSSEQYQIRVIDVSNPGYLTQVASVTGPGRADGVEADSNYVYVLAWTNSVRELHIFE